MGTSNTGLPSKSGGEPGPPSETKGDGGGEEVGERHADENHIELLRPPSTSEWQGSLLTHLRSSRKRLRTEEPGHHERPSGPRAVSPLPGPAARERARTLR